MGKDKSVKHDYLMDFHRYATMNAGRRAGKTSSRRIHLDENNLVVDPPTGTVKISIDLQNADIFKTVLERFEFRVTQRIKDALRNSIA